jgi:hypothetical protein
MNPYEDILNLDRPVSETRPKMSQLDRAAQFSPFAALTGYGDAIDETGRLTQTRVELDEHQKSLLDERLRALAARIGSAPELTATWFVPDAKKAGGAYVTRTGRLRRIDPARRLLQLTDGTEIPIEDIYDIE